MLEALLSLFILAPLLPLLPATHWSIRFFDFVRLQTSAIQVILLISAFMFWDYFTPLRWILISVMMLVLAYQLWLIRPYTPFYHRRKPKNKFHKDQLKLVTANVLQTNTRYDDFINLIRNSDPDIFVTMESDEHWDEALSKAFPAYKHTVKATLDNFYGMHIYSKLAFKASRIDYLIQKDVPSMHCELLFAKQEFNLIIIHPAPPSPTENETSKERDAELMIIGRKCRESEEATLVCGDLNDVVWSKTSRLFKKMTGYFDPRIGRGLYPSFHANYWLLRFPLDHLFYSKDLYVPVIKRLERFGSDHFAMYYEIAFPLIDVDVANPNITQEEHQEIDEIIDDGIQSARETEEAQRPKIVLQ